MNNTPRIAITPGEPAGIGPDLTLALAHQHVQAEVVILADPDLLESRAAARAVPIRLREWQPGQAAAPHQPGTLSVLPIRRQAPTTPGQLDPRNAQYVLNTLEKGIDLCADDTFDALVTGPVQKSVINDAGIPFTGHTEFLARRTAAPRPVMLLATPGLRVALVTTHVALGRVPECITHDDLAQVLRILDTDLRKHWNITCPHVLVTGLNPHAGEGGYLGREEQNVIMPVIEELQRAGLSLEGPLPADTAFTPPHLARADAVLTMYHDQGLPVIKHMGFGRTVNITLGLPIIRTSVDHGTALDLAGTDRGDPSSLRAALDMAIEMAANAEK